MNCKYEIAEPHMYYMALTKYKVLYIAVNCIVNLLIEINK